VKELKAFQRISLNPDEKKNVQFTIHTDQLAFYGLDMKRVVEPGMFNVYVGGNSVDVLGAQFEVVAK
jgi:beta-glucosidase